MASGERASRSCPCAEGKGSSGSSSESRVLPPSREQMGRASWKLLHRAVAHFPDNPGAVDRRRVFFWLISFASLYPCSICRSAFLSIILQHRPNTSSQRDLVLWACRVHNAVNDDLSLPIFNCLDPQLFARRLST
ncbi:FAD-linked sulfhydryl oxidase ERV2-like [Cyclospora cayetanensis]|uniref:Sulfhydryl oxidase n=1 Tax=Cyclospora cayetanensis TaxID=88456 RepID=A0A6P6RZ64_9EIME|nr:FAD-linked sulfhydryl oxidase ERV2-like [Cyclospora cayetanensis]